MKDYAGQEIYIAFRLRSKNCEHLILDNIELYNGTILPTAINDVVDAAVNVTVNGTTIEVCGDGVVAVNLYSADGSLVAKSNGNLTAADVATGVYVVNVVTETSTYNKTILVK